MGSEWKNVTQPYQALFNVSFVKPNLYTYPSNLYPYAVPAKGGDTSLALHQPDELMGSPKVKLYTNHSFRLTSKVSLQANMLYLARKNGMTDFGKTGTFGPQHIEGAGVLLDGLVKGLDVDLSVHDIFNWRLRLITPYYDGGYDALNYKGREISISATYKF